MYRIFEWMGIMPAYTQGIDIAPHPYWCVRRIELCMVCFTWLCVCLMRCVAARRGSVQRLRLLLPLSL